MSDANATRPAAFRCPRCGGPFFGTYYRREGESVVPDTINCHGTVAGHADAKVSTPGGTASRGELACGWSDAYREDHECWVRGEDGGQR